MAMAGIDKWLTDGSPDDRTSEVADRTLRSRLAAVHHYLPLAAAKSEEDIEYVHELRVATRRAMAALRLFADMLPRNRTAQLTKQLKRIRRAAGAARDYDVLAQRLSDGHSDAQARRLLDKIRSRRRKAQRRIRAVNRRLQKENRFQGLVKKLLRGVRRRFKGKGASKNPRFGEWARTHLWRTVNRFFKMVPTEDTDVATLHRFRIRAKELRYEMELLAGAFPPDFAEALYQAVETLQQQLGEINDHVIALSHLRQRTNNGYDPLKRGPGRSLLEYEQESLNQSRQQFFQWWTPQRRDNLRSRFNELLACRLDLATA